MPSRGGGSPSETGSGCREARVRIPSIRGTHLLRPRRHTDRRAPLPTPRHRTHAMSPAGMTLSRDGRPREAPPVTTRVCRTEAATTRPDLSEAVGPVSGHDADPSNPHVSAAERRYGHPNGSKDTGIEHRRTAKRKSLHAYANRGRGRCHERQRLTTGSIHRTTRRSNVVVLHARSHSCNVTHRNRHQPAHEIVWISNLPTKFV